MINGNGIYITQQSPIIIYVIVTFNLGREFTHMQTTPLNLQHGDEICERDGPDEQAFRILQRLLVHGDLDVDEAASQVLDIVSDVEEDRTYDESSFGALAGFEVARQIPFDHPAQIMLVKLFKKLATCGKMGNFMEYRCNLQGYFGRESCVPNLIVTVVITDILGFIKSAVYAFSFLNLAPIHSLGISSRSKMGQN
jgi:hypothetical protein